MFVMIFKLWKPLVIGGVVIGYGVIGYKGILLNENF